MKPIQCKTTNNKKNLARLNGTIDARECIKGFNQSSRVTGLTNGAFSLISLIEAVLEITGKADIVISTWSAGFYDISAIGSLMESGNILSSKLIIDRSFATRKGQYTMTVDEVFKPENIRTTNTHSKFVLIKNDEWNVCIRSSMNLNENLRCENFDLDNDIDIYNLFNEFSENLFKNQKCGIIENRSVVDPVFNDLFGCQQSEVQEISETDWDAGIEKLHWNINNE